MVPDTGATARRLSEHVCAVTALYIGGNPTSFTRSTSLDTSTHYGGGLTSADLVGTGACAPDPCGRTQVRKVNVNVTARSQNKVPPRMVYLHNTLESQVSFRGMAFVDQYR